MKGYRNEGKYTNIQQVLYHLVFPEYTGGVGAGSLLSVVVFSEARGEAVGVGPRAALLVLMSLSSQIIFTSQYSGAFFCMIPAFVPPRFNLLLH
jgi:hypothetical protein